MSGGGSAPSTTTTISKSEPPEYVKPYSIEMMNRSAELANNPIAQYGGQRIAGMDSRQQLGLDMTTQRAIAGSPVMNSAKSNMQSTLNGDYLDANSNPYMAQMAKTVGDDVQTRMAAMGRGSGSGMTNSGWQEATARGMTDSLGNLYGQNYANERSRQMQAAQLAPQYAQADYQDAQNLIGAGDAYRTYNQDLLNQQYQDWQTAQNAPYQQLDVLANGIRTSMGGGGTNTSTGPNPYQANRMAGMIGGGLAGYGISQMAGGNPYLYSGAGAVAGGLL